MKSQEFDRLFREKLKGHQLQPSANAWEKLQKKRKKKTKNGYWLFSIAAAIALLLLSTIVIISNEANKSMIKPQRTAYPQKSIVIANLHGIYLADLNVREDKSPDNIIEASQILAKSDKEQNAISSKSEIQESFAHNQKSGHQKFDLLESKDNKEQIAFEQILPKEDLAKIPETEQVKIEIAFRPAVNLEPEETKNLRAERKGLTEKLNQMARDVRRGSVISLSELREAKNDLLAFNFLFNPEKIEEDVPE